MSEGQVGARQQEEAPGSALRSRETPGLESCFYHFLAVWPCICHETSAILSYPIFHTINHHHETMSADLLILEDGRAGPGNQGGWFPIAYSLQLKGEVHRVSTMQPLPREALSSVPAPGISPLPLQQEGTATILEGQQITGTSRRQSLRAHCRGICKVHRPSRIRIGL